MVCHIWRQIWSSRLNAQQRRDFERRFLRLHALTGWCVTLLPRSVRAAAAAAAAPAAAAVSRLLHLEVKRKKKLGKLSSRIVKQSYSYVRVPPPDSAAS